MPKSKKNDFYGSAISRSEIDMRSEFSNTMYGNGPEIAKHQKGLLRVFRREEDGSMITCSCVSRVTGEPDRESRCPICLGEGKLWDEINIDFYHMEGDSRTSLPVQERLHTAGLMNTNFEVFYIPWQFDLTTDDKIVVLKLDKQGQPIIPLTRFQMFRISDLRELRLDNGRLEFWKAFTYEDNSKFL